MAAQAPVIRPARGFTPARAQKWILACAIATAVTYVFRLIVAPSMSTPRSSSKAKRLAGAGAPPSPEHWAVAYTAAFLMLSMISLGAPELAASLALMGTLGNVLTNGTTIVAELTGLENASAPAAAPAPAIPTSLLTPTPPNPLPNTPPASNRPAPQIPTPPVINLPAF